MKQKKYLILAAAAALFAACSSDDGPTAPEQQAAAQAGSVPVAFDTYVNRGTTRAGKIGEQTIDQLGTYGTTTNYTDKTVGFGVFAYYTNADNYDQTFQPNFMYNQYVYGDANTDADEYADTWKYSPIKYWPNEFGTNALSDDKDKISFFAYAPFVSVNPSSGKVKDPSKDAPATYTYTEDNGDATMGIVGMKSNSATGDPMVKYISTFYTDKQVDLTWGTTAKAANPANPSTISWGLKNSGNQNITEGKPWLNVEHPTKTSTDWDNAQKVKFVFQHSLAALNVQVDTYADKVTTGHAASADPAANTKVFIRSVTFEGFDTKGALNLNNVEVNKALWYNFDCENELNNGNEVTIKDGRKDGKEGVSEATKEYAAINKTFVQQQGLFSAAGDGVTGTAKNLFCKADKESPDADTDPIYVIPNGDKLKVTIEYDVMTADNKLAGKLNDGATNGSVVKNVITRYITTSEAGAVGASGGDVILENGKKYLIKLHLGLNSVEFEAEVHGWDAGETGGADLPHNN